MAVIKKTRETMMGKKHNNKSKENNTTEQILTIVGWIVIIFAIIALAMFIIKSGVFA